MRSVLLVRPIRPPLLLLRQVKGKGKNKNVIITVITNMPPRCAYVMISLVHLLDPFFFAIHAFDDEAQGERFSIGGAALPLETKRGGKGKKTSLLFRNYYE